MQKFLITLFFIGILIRGSFTGDGTWQELEVLPDYSGELTTNECPEDWSHIMNYAKRKYPHKYFVVSCEDFDHLIKNQITGEFRTGGLYK